MNFSPLRISKVETEGPFQASKWLKVPVLLDVNELRALLNLLPTALIYRTSSLVKEGEEVISHAEFISIYSNYIATLKEGKIPGPEYRLAFSPILTCAADHLYRVVTSDSSLVRIAKPVIQMQAHVFDYSPADGKFRSMVLGPNTISWGLQFSYPQLFQENSTNQIFKVSDTPQFPNTHLFHILQQWVRRHTIPIPVVIHDKVINVPIRIGKECLSWINNHAQLQAKGLKIKL